MGDVASEAWDAYADKGGNELISHVGLVGAFILESTLGSIVTFLGVAAVPSPLILASTDGSIHTFLVPCNEGFCFGFIFARICGSMVTCFDVVLASFVAGNFVAGILAAPTAFFCGSAVLFFPFGNFVGNALGNGALWAAIPGTGVTLDTEDSGLIVFTDRFR